MQIEYKTTIQPIVGTCAGCINDVFGTPRCFEFVQAMVAQGLPSCTENMDIIYVIKDADE